MFVFIKIFYSQSICRICTQRYSLFAFVLDSYGVRNGQLVCFCADPAFCCKVDKPVWVFVAIEILTRVRFNRNWVLGHFQKTIGTCLLAYYDFKCATFNELSLPLSTLLDLTSLVTKSLFASAFYLRNVSDFFPITENGLGRKST